jgi:hypothetical protein
MRVDVGAGRLPFVGFRLWRPRYLLGGIVVRETQVTLPELGLIAGTRVALGVGLGLLLANRLPEDQRRAVGWTLLLLGAATTVPLAFEVLGKARRSAPEGWPEQAVGGPRSEAAERFGQRSEPART